MSSYLLAIDQGTTSSRAIIFTLKGQLLSQHQINLTQSYPQPGWVEQNPEEIWRHTLKCCREVLSQTKLSAHQIVAIGISNQRETTLIWDRQTGNVIYPAIVWQDRRTSHFCKQYEHKMQELNLSERTGLLLDPYFSATKINWILDNVPLARERAEKGELAFGTVDSFLLWRLTGGKIHATDATNASRTLLFNLRSQSWDKNLLEAFNIPSAILPSIYDSSADFGQTLPEFFGGSIPICSMIGDQQAATVGQACFNPGMIKSTYGTGCFMLLNTGDQMIQSKHRLLTTVAYRLNGKVTYGLEGSIFNSGTLIKWLRDTMKLIPTAADSEPLAASIQDTEGVYIIPAFTGLGAPYWVPEARAAIVGLTLNSNVTHIVRAALEAVAYQTKDLLEAMCKDSGEALTVLRVDGGMTVNKWLMQFLADILNIKIQVPLCMETSALGAAYLAGLEKGVYQSLTEIEDLWQAKQTWMPKLTNDKREKWYQGWQNAIKQIALS